MQKKCEKPGRKDKVSTVVEDAVKERKEKKMNVARERDVERRTETDDCSWKLARTVETKTGLGKMRLDTNSKDAPK